ncbi:metallophosphoesterase [Pseudoalteromonas denitrificans]|uniref:Calcineurin-like phosphoesterase n=1 Tax=Pseudoalteromonas denitrificans DSM 6059 TaxID=1123010 RepID=A0A1I1UTN4_9GAMM|nr:metallophosphoesterase [Pseudoalteromonas denitrificans]SFD74029.1 Calcineurin-like phosphoesterase [Pseudoalteromonas denitrificans DSM 6059]
MKKYIWLFNVVLTAFFTQLNAHEKYSDGPYLINGKDALMEYQITDNQLTISEYSEALLIPQKFNIDGKDNYTKVEKIAAISDVHGQVGIFSQLLEKNGVIDALHNWSWGKGHLVITGDIFDRGDTVTEALWLVYKLEQQALKAGGKLHYLLGNHEYMVLRGDDRYLHNKYIKTLNLVNRDLKSLFSINTVLGRWLRSKATVIKINDFVFLHGGIHQDFLDLNLSLEQTNEQFRQSIGLSKEDIKQNDIFNILQGATGPVWYRGFFTDTNLNQVDIEKILKQIKAKHIIVGHTSMDQLETRFDNRILAIDSSIKNAEKGELLIWRKKQFMRGNMQGVQTRLF